MGVTWTGLDEWKRALAQLPEHLTDEARGIVLRHATAAHAEIVNGYAVYMGPSSYIGGRLVTPEHIREAVDLVSLVNDRFTTGFRVVNRSPLAWVIENGAANRKTQSGANRGSTKPAHVFIPPSVRQREAMYGALKAMLVREGLVVKGEADRYA